MIISKSISTAKIDFEKANGNTNLVNLHGNISYYRQINCSLHHREIDGEANFLVPTYLSDIQLRKASFAHA